jgi:hypothetical protein
MSAPKVPEVKPAPPPLPPQAPIEEDKAPMVETAVDVDKEAAAKKKKKVGTSALQTSSGLNIPTVSGLNIT